MSSGRNSCSRQRESSAPITSWYGFSVVAPDERHEPGLDDGQERVLLRLVEAVDLVEEEDRALAVRAEPVARPRDDRLDVRLAGVDGGELLERGARDRGDQARDRRLARARAGRTGSPSRGGPPRSCGASGAPGPSRCSWPATSSSVRGPQSLGERRARGRERAPGRLGEEIVHGADATRTERPSRGGPYDVFDGCSAAGRGHEAPVGPDPHRHREPAGPRDPRRGLPAVVPRARGHRLRAVAQGSRAREPRRADQGQRRGAVADAARPHGRRAGRSRRPGASTRSRASCRTATSGDAARST